MSPTASLVLGFSKGGKTATGKRPSGSKANEAAKVGIVKALGNPPPPKAPTCTDPGGATACYEERT